MSRSASVFLSAVTSLVAALLGSCIQQDRLAAPAADVTPGPDILIGADIAQVCDSNSCIIDGACVPDGTLKGGAPCLACRVDEDPSAWSPLDDNASCDDDDPCTLASVCADGICRGTREPECVDPPACVERVECDGGGCTQVIEAGWCLIDDQCVEGGAASVNNPCRVCDPSADSLAWTELDGPSCDDGDPCTSGGVCQSGLCVGTPVCDDGLDCTEDLCDAQGSCSHTLKSGYCLIGQVCRALGEVNEDNPCLGCKNTHNDQWSPLTGRTCDTGNPCAPEGRCQGSTCHETRLLELDPEPNDDKYHPLTEGAEAVDTFPGGSLDGNFNPPNDVDRFKFKVPFVFGDAGLRPTVQVAIPSGAAVTLRLSFRCGPAPDAQNVPSMSCPQSASIFQDSVTGARGCEWTAGAGEDGTLEAAIAPTCLNDGGSIEASSVGTAFIELSAPTLAPDGAQCMGYTLTWGAKADD